LFKGKTNNEKFDITATTSFFLQDSNSKYALFNEDGKQLTDFVYTSVGTFVNSAAKVAKDNQVGIINADGKLTVPLGKYEHIRLKGGLYSVSEIVEDSYKDYLINGKGKVLYNLDNVNVHGFIGIDTFLILEFEKENKYVAINYDDKELVIFSKSGDGDPFVNEENGYISIFYNNKNWIFNVNNGKQLASIDSELYYCVNNVSDDENIIMLNSCTIWYQNQNETYYKFIKDGKLYDKTGECDVVSENNGNLFCHKGSDRYILDSNLNIGFKTYFKAYNNADGYVADNLKSFNGVDFYNDGKVVKNIPCRTLEETGYIASDIYVLGTYFSKPCGTDSGTYDFYKSDGEKLIEKSFRRVKAFDSNGLSIVSEDKINYYMLDNIGKQVGGTYSNISFDDEFYIITNNDLKGIMNKESKELVDTLYSNVYIWTNNTRTFAYLKTTDNKYIIYDLDKNKELFSLDNIPNTNHKHYITIFSNGKTQYYSFNGKMFYEK